MNKILSIRATAVALSLASLGPVLTGCDIFGWGEPDLPPLVHSPGFFADFEQMVNDSLEAGSPAQQASALDAGFTEALEDGPDADETVAVGAIWTKVSAYLEIGLRTAAVMEGVAGAEQNRVTMLTSAADVVLRTDVPALRDWNQRVTDLGEADAAIAPTGDIVWTSLNLTLTEAEQTTVQVWVESGEWIDGYWERSPGYYLEIWVPGYYESVWQDGSCYDVYDHTECTTYWQDGYCYDEWIDAGYWDSACTAWDEWGNCVEWSDVWVDTGYYQTICDQGGYYDECIDVYQTVCEEGGWVDVWVEGYYTQGPWIPGETYWVEGYWADTSGYEPRVMVEEELEILREGVDVVLAFDPGVVSDGCRAGLQAALDDSAQAPLEGAGQIVRDAIISCMSPE